MASGGLFSPCPTAPLLCQTVCHEDARDMAFSLKVMPVLQPGPLLRRTCPQLPPLPHLPMVVMQGFLRIRVELGMSYGFEVPTSPVMPAQAGISCIKTERPQPPLG